MKKIITEEADNEIFLYDVNGSKIILWLNESGFPEYKLHRVKDEPEEQFAFISLDDSRCYANGVGKFFEIIKDSIYYGAHLVVVNKFEYLKKP